MATSSIIITSNAKGTVEPVNLNNIYTFRKFDQGEWSIQFYKSEEVAAHNVISWKYETEEARDCDYKLIVKEKVENISEV
jgi:hypothetical protein